MAYTSPSTAENHMLEQKVVVRPATIPANISAMPSAWLVSPSLPNMANLPNIIATQPASTPAMEVHIPDMRFTANAISAGSLDSISATQVNIRPTNKNIGAPGG